MKTLTLFLFKKYLHPRPRLFHKGNAGHVLIIGGDDGYAGAVRLAGEAALRVGAGLVSVATRVEHSHVQSSARPEIMFHGIRSHTQLKSLLVRADIIAIGPGLGQSSWARDLFFKVIGLRTKPLVLDADALHLLAKHPSKRQNWILTPHPGEAADLLKTTSQHIQENRTHSIQKLQSQYNGVCVLKGAGSLVLGPSAELMLCKAGNPGMATGGMGDVLTGVIAGLLAQSIPLEIAAQLGVLLHAKAGDLAAKGGERGIIASDLMPHLRHLVNPK